MPRVTRLPQDPERVYRRRVEAGLTQEQLAQLAGVSDATISRIENGDSRATIKSLSGIAAALGCEIADLTPDEAATTAAAS